MKAKKTNKNKKKPTININKTINLKDILIIPFDNLIDGEIKSLFVYFLYKAPNISSMHSRKINEQLHEELFKQMIKQTNFNFAEFRAKKNNLEKEFKNTHLIGDSINIDTKRFVCGRKNRESSLQCFLRHIRNSLAHGRVYFVKRTNRASFIFEDSKDKGNITARIVCVKSDLKEWKKILEKEENYISDVEKV